MRPHVQETDGDEARIIYLGDVRRRRRSAARRQEPDHHYLAAAGLGAAAAWATWLTVLFTLHPAKLLTYLAFFVPLGIALGTTGAITAYAAEWRAGRLPGLRDSLRRGFLFAGFIVANLAVLAAHRWSVIVLGATAVAVMSLEVTAARRRF